MKKRTKVTPRWLSIWRKLHTYIGGSTIITMTLTRAGWTAEDILLVFEWWAGIGVIIQIICDASFNKEGLQDMPADPIKPKLRS